MSKARIKNQMPSAAMIVAAVALIVAMAGSAVALEGKNTVDAGDLKKNSVRSAEIKKNAVQSADVASNAISSTDLEDDGVNGADVDESSLDLNIPSDQVGEYPPNSFRVTAAIGATEAEARAAAPEIPLTSNGPLSLYGKCFYDVANGDAHGETYIRTTQNGSIFQSRASDDEKQGGAAATDFLNGDTPEIQRQIEVTEETTLNEAEIDYDDQEPFFAAAPDGTQIHGLFEVAVKNGTLPGGDGIYGPGDACIFTGYTFG